LSTLSIICRFTNRSIARHIALLTNHQPRAFGRAFNPGADTMTKHQTATVNTALARLPALGADYAARVLSALHRSAMRAAQQREIAAIAAAHGLTRSPDWIV
jgi:hypothetical protein